MWCKVGYIRWQDPDSPTTHTPYWETKRINYFECVLYLKKFFPLVAKQMDDSVQKSEKQSLVLIPLPNFNMEIRDSDEIYSMFVDSVKLTSGVILDSAHFIYNKTAESAVSFYRYGSESVHYVYYKTVENR